MFAIVQMLMRVQVLALGEEGAPAAVRVEVSSENDLFLLYTHAVDTASFTALREGQRLTVDFEEYPNILMRSFNNTIKDPHTFLAVFVISRSGAARLDFIQVRAACAWVALALPRGAHVAAGSRVSGGRACCRGRRRTWSSGSWTCSRAPSSARPRRPCGRASRSATMRSRCADSGGGGGRTGGAGARARDGGACAQSRLAVMLARLHDVSSLVKLKNPSLLLHLEAKSAPERASLRSRR